MDKETRTFACELRADASENRKLIGHAAVFNETTEIGGLFRERIAPGTFQASIKSDDVRALFNHDPNLVLGRNTAGTLELSEDETGLKTTIDPPNTQFARDLSVSIERGDISQMSFAFQVLEDDWTRGDGKELDLRTVKKVRLFDVSPVTFPAYSGTDIALRSRAEWAKSQAQPDPPAQPADTRPASLAFRRKLIEREL